MQRVVVGAAVVVGGRVEASSLDALEVLLDGHPHLQLDGSAIEVHQFLPIPGMKWPA
ncbi:MAG TPA: hypothetical protein VM282_22500 [Acidimicrobiales bacterium]|nr:hypothetical protein [Acidimicrobiales bacterium]